MNIWQRAVEMAERLLDISDRKNSRESENLLEQWHAAMENESTTDKKNGYTKSTKELKRILDLAERSRNRNMNELMRARKQGLISEDLLASQLRELEEEGRMIESFRDNLQGK